MEIRDYKVYQGWIKSLSPEQFQQHLDGVLHDGEIDGVLYGVEMNLRQNGYPNAKVSSGMNQAAFADRLEDIIQRKINTLNWLEKK